MKPITLFWRSLVPDIKLMNLRLTCSSDQVPNPSKVLIILEELGLPYQSKWVELEELKAEPFTSVNPNGRVPAIIDPNTEITLFESGAIVSYLISTYDKTNSLTYTSFPNTFQLQQWAYFQASGQGPYYGQAAWFTFFHSEPLPSARERYYQEIRRVVAVLNSHLKDKSWLVGDKCTYADLSFVMWSLQIPYIMKDADEPWDIEKYPDYKRWMEAMQARNSVKHVVSVLMDKEVNSEGRTL